MASEMSPYKPIIMLLINCHCSPQTGPVTSDIWWCKSISWVNNSDIEHITPKRFDISYTLCTILGFCSSTSSSSGGNNMNQQQWNILLNLSGLPNSVFSPMRRVIAAPVLAMPAYVKSVP